MNADTVISNCKNVVDSAIQFLIQTAAELGDWEAAVELIGELSSPVNQGIALAYIYERMTGMTIVQLVDGGLI